MKLLLVEDEQELSKAVKTMLEMSGYSVDLAKDGIEALNYINDIYYDGIISDIMMPRMDGISLLKEIRGQGLDTPILLLTAKAQVEDKVEGLDAGANDYLAKPFAFKELMARIRSMINLASKNSISNLTYRSIKLSVSTYELAGEEASIRLSSKEGKILSLFLKNPNKIIPIEKLDSMMTCIDTKEVELYASILNNKLDAVNADFKLIKMDSGYRLEAV